MQKRSDLKKKTLVRCICGHKSPAHDWKSNINLKYSRHRETWKNLYMSDRHWQSWHANIIKRVVNTTLRVNLDGYARLRGTWSSIHLHDHYYLFSPKSAPCKSRHGSRFWQTRTDPLTLFLILWISRKKSLLVSLQLSMLGLNMDAFPFTVYFLLEEYGTWTSEVRQKLRVLT